MLKTWMKNKKERKESRKRFEDLSEEETQELNAVEKAAYLKVAKKQITYQGKINAYRDFPVEEQDKIEIDRQDSNDEEKEIEEELEEIGEIPELELYPKIREIDELNNGDDIDANQVIRKM